MKRYVAKAVKESAPATRMGIHDRAELRRHRASSQAARATIRRLAFREWMQDIRDRAAARTRKAAAQ
jgi:hypothetical protein